MYILFNKTTRLPVAFTDDISIFPQDSLVREIDVGESFNLARYRWEGTYEDGRLMDLFEENMTIVTEEEVENRFFKTLFSKYSGTDIICAILDDRGNFDEIKKYFNELKKEKLAEIEMYQNSSEYIYETREQQRSRAKQSFK